MFQVLSVPCIGTSHSSGTWSFSGSCQIKIIKTRWEGLQRRLRPWFIWRGHLMGQKAPGRCCFWGTSKWTCQMPQTGNRKLLLNDVKYKKLFQVRKKLRFPPSPPPSLVTLWRHSWTNKIKRLVTNYFTTCTNLMNLQHYLAKLPGEILKVKKNLMIKTNFYKSKTCKLNSNTRQHC